MSVLVSLQTPLAMLQIVSGFGGLAIAFLLSVLVVAFGTYVGVLMALQSFFGASRWADLDPDERRRT